MSYTRRVFVSVPIDEHLDARRQDLKARIIERVTRLGYEPQIFWFRGMAAALVWNFKTVDEVMRRCHGALVIGFARWRFTTDTGTVSFPTEYNHYEGALANARKLPILTIAERGIVDRGIHWTGGGNPILFMPQDADRTWLDSETFGLRFQLWADQLAERKDVFLGYCSEARHVAQAIHLFLSEKLKLSVLDWGMDFTSGARILDEIGRAARQCMCGIFLFTRDDPMEGEGHLAAPRDNVVFEAGFFTNSKGKDRVLIIREEGVKVPADLGGDIYVVLPASRNTSVIEGQVRDFLDRRL